MREVKKHWMNKQSELKNPRTVCGQKAYWARIAHMKRKVTCKRCQRILAGYTGESK